MELNYDCFRKVMLVLEQELTIADEYAPENGPRLPVYTLKSLLACKEIKGYSEDDVIYCLYNLEQAGYIHASIDFSALGLQTCQVNDITFQGHMFIKSVKSDKVWSKVKKAIGSVGTASLPVILELAKSFAMSAITGS